MDNCTCTVVYAPPGGQAIDLDGLLGRPLDAMSYQALEDKYPSLAEAVQAAAENGYTPTQIRQYALQRGMPLAWARWLEQAARHLEGDGE